MGTGYSVTTPPVVIFATLSPPVSVNQRLPSGPVTIAYGLAPGVGTGNSVITPAVVARAMLLPPYSVNQRLPSGPVVSPEGPLLEVGVAYGVKYGSASALGIGATAIGTSRATTVATTRNVAIATACGRMDRIVGAT